MKRELFPLKSWIEPAEWEVSTSLKLLLSPALTQGYGEQVGDKYWGDSNDVL